jgi:hypothetical protein
MFPYENSISTNVYFIRNICQDLSFNESDDAEVLGQIIIENVHAVEDNPNGSLSFFPPSRRMLG